MANRPQFIILFDHQFDWIECTFRSHLLNSSLVCRCNTQTQQKDEPAINIAFFLLSYDFQWITKNISFHFHSQIVLYSQNHNSATLVCRMNYNNVKSRKKRIERKNGFHNDQHKNDILFVFAIECLLIHFYNKIANQTEKSYFIEQKRNDFTMEFACSCVFH